MDEHAGIVMCQVFLLAGAGVAAPAHAEASVTAMTDPQCRQPEAHVEGREELAAVERACESPPDPCHPYCGVESGVTP